MQARSPGRFLVAAIVFGAGVLTCPAGVFAQPKICGNQPALGNWSLASCPVLRDDDGDGIYSVTLSLSDSALLEYKVLPSGLWDGNEVRALGTCPADGGSRRNDTQNIQIVQPDTRGPATFYFDPRSLTDPSYATVSGNRSAADSLMLRAPATACPRWLVVGDFQNLYGDNGSAAPLFPLRPGVWVGRITAAKALSTGWRWKVLEGSATVAREYGPGGWAYAPCEAGFATVSSPVNVGDSVYFLLHERGGRMQTLVATAPLDGFASDGSPGCETGPDLGSDPRDLGGRLSDAATPPRTADASTDAGGERRPGIHCDCQIGSPTPAPPPTGMLGLCGGLSLLLLRAGRRRRQRPDRTAGTPAASACRAAGFTALVGVCHR